jgi:Sec-independent protein translocase protein TatA
MFGLSAPHMLIFGIVAMLLFGNRLPSMPLIRRIRSVTGDLYTEFNTEVHQ